MHGTAGQSSSRLLDRILQRQSIDPMVFRALVHAFVLMDLRNQQFGKSTATGPKARLAPLFWVLGQNLIVGLICSIVLFARVDVQFFTLVGLCASAIIVGSAVIVEFREIVLDPQDLAILGHRPIPARTFAAARVTNLLVYLLACSCSAGLFPAVVGAGLRDAGWWQLVAYMGGALIGDFFIAGAVIVVYVLVQRDGPTNALQESLAWLQVGLILVLFYGGQVLLRDGSQPLSWIAYQPPAWVAYLPFTWLANGICAAGRGGPVGLQILVGGIVVNLVLWWFVLDCLSRRYEKMQPGRPAWAPQSSPPLATPGELAGPLGKWVTRPGEERAAFWLTWVMLDRDPNLRMRCWPSLAIVFALFGVGALTGQLLNPLAVSATQCALTLASVYLVGEAAPSLLHQMRFSSDHEASWVLGTAPIDQPAAFARGLCKALWIRFVVPLCAMAFVLFVWIWRDPLSSGIHAGLLGLAGWSFLVGSAAIQFRTIPFRSPLAKGESFGPIAGLTAAMTAVAMTFAALHGLAASHRTWFAIYVGTAVLIGLCTHVLAFRWLARRLARGLIG
jgi:hypothetical protein